MNSRALAGRTHGEYVAFLIHRISGIGLSVFLPLHFYVLGLVLEESAFDDVLVWTDNILVKVMEAGLLGLLGVHMAGGIRILVLEFRTNDARDLKWIKMTALAGIIVALAFLVSAVVLGGA